MKHIIIIAAFAAIATSAQAQSLQYRSGYITQRGTYVAPHYATTPNATRLDNYSTRGNSNPFTGATGYKSPYTAPSTPRYYYRAR